MNTSEKNIAGPLSSEYPWPARDNHPVLMPRGDEMKCGFILFLIFLKNYSKNVAGTLIQDKSWSSHNLGKKWLCIGTTGTRETSATMSHLSKDKQKGWIQPCYIAINLICFKDLKWFQSAIFSNKLYQQLTILLLWKWMLLQGWTLIAFCSKWIFLRLCWQDLKAVHS